MTHGMNPMIVVTRLDRRLDTTYAINPDLIERIVETPDTTLHMADGSTHIVAESMHEVIDLISDYRARVISLARDYSSAPAGTGQALSVVHSADRAAGEASVLPLPRK